MLAAIVGGKLQGVEAAYLAKKAGWRTILADKEDAVPARHLCDRFIRMDVTRLSALDAIPDSVDILLPALENQEALDLLHHWGRQKSIPVAYAPDAYAISSSKIASDALFAAMYLPVPIPWPACRFPILAKPGGGSGSRGVRILKNRETADAFFTDGSAEKDWVFQQYLQGPSFSIEILGTPGNYTPLQITELFMDRVCDCKRVTAPCTLTEDQVREMEKLAVTLAEAVQLNGLMDVEVILHEGKFKLLEIDARLPSQTPMAVYHSTGWNMVEMLGNLFAKGEYPDRRMKRPPRGVILEHVRVTPRAVHVEGEHIMAEAGPLRPEKNFFGADEALTNFQEGKENWAATLIHTGGTPEEASAKRNRVLEKLRRQFHLSEIVDDFPPDVRN